MSDKNLGNSVALDYFDDLSNQAIDITATKINKCNDFSDTDALFVLKYADKNSVVLDVASGTGITVNKYYDKVKKVIALEKFTGFSKFIVKSKNVEIINEDLFDYKTDEKFDVITLFGIMHYVSAQEAKIIYHKMKNMLKPNGKLLIKQQFGVKDDVIINGYSDELKRDYYSEYRYINNEVNLLKDIGFANTEVIDIYPPEANRWDNTHFYAIVAEM